MSELNPVGARVGGLGADRVGSRGSVDLSAKKGLGAALHVRSGGGIFYLPLPVLRGGSFGVPSHTNASQRKKLRRSFFAVFALFRVGGIK